jgi:hypothetical protein
VTALEAFGGNFGNEAVWSGNDTNHGDFCGGMAVATGVPDKCSGRLGAKLESTPPEVEAKLRSAYRISITTATGLLPHRAFVWVDDSSGHELTAGMLNGRFGIGSTDIIYMEATGPGGAVDHLDLTLIPGATTLEPWVVHTVTVTTLATGVSHTFTVDRLIPSGTLTRIA